MEILSLGDSALIVRVGASEEVLRIKRLLELAEIPGVIECVPANESVAVYFDIAAIGGEGSPPITLREKIAAALRGDLSLVRQEELLLIEIPVCYEEEFAPDLPEVARLASLSLSEVVRRYCAVEYRVHCLGFLPGFAYLGGLPRELATPRRATPRAQVPAGAVGIGGAQTGIYPTESPGGWNLIGRSPVCLFDVQRIPPALLSTGARVRFRQIDRSEFERLASAISR